MLKAAGHGYSQLLMDLLPIAIIGSVCALLLAWRMHSREQAER
jgi:Mg2+/citrate symporter